MAPLLVSNGFILAIHTCRAAFFLVKSTVPHLHRLNWLTSHAAGGLPPPFTMPLYLHTAEVPGLIQQSTPQFVPVEVLQIDSASGAVLVGLSLSGGGSSLHWVPNAAPAVQPGALQGHTAIQRPSQHPVAVQHGPPARAYQACRGTKHASDSAHSAPSPNLTCPAASVQAR